MQASSTKPPSFAERPEINFNTLSNIAIGNYSLATAVSSISNPSLEELAGVIEALRLSSATVTQMITALAVLEASKQVLLTAPSVSASITLANTGRIDLDSWNNSLFIKRNGLVVFQNFVIRVLIPELYYQSFVSRGWKRGGGGAGDGGGSEREGGNGWNEAPTSFVRLGIAEFD